MAKKKEKKISVQIRLSEKEHESLLEASKKAGLSKAAFAKKAVLKAMRSKKEVELDIGALVEKAAYAGAEKAIVRERVLMEAEARSAVEATLVEEPKRKGLIGRLFGE